MDQTWRFVLDCKKCRRIIGEEVTAKGYSLDGGKIKLLKEGERQLEAKHKEVEPDCTGKIKDFRVYGQETFLSEFKRKLGILVFRR